MPDLESQAPLYAAHSNTQESAATRKSVLTLAAWWWLAQACVRPLMQDQWHVRNCDDLVADTCDP